MKLDHAIRWKLTPLSVLYGTSFAIQEDLVRDDSGEVLYYDEDTAVAEAMRLQDRSDRISYTVEHRPAVISNENKED